MSNKEIVMCIVERRRTTWGFTNIPFYWRLKSVMYTVISLTNINLCVINVTGVIACLRDPDQLELKSPGLILTDIPLNGLTRASRWSRLWCPRVYKREQVVPSNTANHTYYMDNCTCIYTSIYFICLIGVNFENYVNHQILSLKIVTCVVERTGFACVTRSRSCWNRSHQCLSSNVSSLDWVVNREYRQGAISSLTANHTGLLILYIPPCLLPCTCICCSRLSCQQGIQTESGILCDCQPLGTV